MVELLEDRRLFHTVAPFALVDGVLTVEGTARRDRIELHTVQTVVTTAVTPGTPNTTTVLESFIVVRVNKLRGFRFDANQVRQIIIRAGGGNDRVTITPGIIGASVNGGGGDDVITGGSGDDSLSGGRGNDRLLGRGGNDYLAGEEDDDTLIGGPGLDRLEGGPGRNRLVQD